MRTPTLRAGLILALGLLLVGCEEDGFDPTPALAPDGSAMAFAEGSTLYLADDPPNPLWTAPGRIARLRWSPAGERLLAVVYARVPASPRAPVPFAVVCVEVASGRATTLAEGSLTDRRSAREELRAVWEPGGAAVFALLPGQGSFLLLDPAGGASREAGIAAQPLACDPAISPDGSRVALAVREGEAARLQLVERAGGGVSEVARADGFSALAFAPDGKTLVYLARREQRAELWLDSLGRAPRRVALGAVRSLAGVTDEGLLVLRGGLEGEPRDLDELAQALGPDRREALVRVSWGEGPLETLPAQDVRAARLAGGRLAVRLGGGGCPALWELETGVLRTFPRAVAQDLAAADAEARRGNLAAARARLGSLSPEDPREALGLALRRAILAERAGDAASAREAFAAAHRLIEAGAALDAAFAAGVALDGAAELTRDAAGLTARQPQLLAYRLGLACWRGDTAQREALLGLFPSAKPLPQSLREVLRAYPLARGLSDAELARAEELAPDLHELPIARAERTSSSPTQARAILRKALKRPEIAAKGRKALWKALLRLPPPPLRR